MKLKRRNEAPVGGWYYIYKDKTIRANEPGLEKLVRAVENFLIARDLPVPNLLAQEIEDQICARQPEGVCWKGLGDRVQSVIHGVAGAIDSVVGTDLKKKAKKCGKCGSRKTFLNSLT